MSTNESFEEYIKCTEAQLEDTRKMLHLSNEDIIGAIMKITKNYQIREKYRSYISVLTSLYCLRKESNVNLGNLEILVKGMWLLDMPVAC